MDPGRSLVFADVPMGRAKPAIGITAPAGVERRSREPRTKVFVDGRLDVQHADGNAGHGLPLQIHDPTGDRHVVLHEPDAKIFIPLFGVEVDPARAKSFGCGHDDCLVVVELVLRD
jgi:hypothetical protein